MENAVPMKQSRTIQSRLVLPPDTNHHLSIFGGKVLAYIDEVAAIASMKHAKSEIVTAAFDSVDFVSPANVGDILELEAIVTSTGTTSMEVYVIVKALNFRTGEQKITTESFITTVAIDSKGDPIPVPKIYPETEEEKVLYEKGLLRRQQRLERRNNSK
ncbi:acyl-CoA hydrolase [Ureibacillus massiliensis 4400831 = CIP 108448 = CCUG 49529]|uniref:Acyl-CoA hydrolase n=1 Tax=Ureibacillus massiliensis 4400831 = CIP 108448 = CCUG 49529 TaxID=1211035 RepID=A0A0A3J844_9BACL|nr:acyl-CoA thioesterase [Ureibacillus massiliensis]KGR91935.1 acyl-CoA hydrolase [Ureibacillus massiliensis 4400831 = CIP 108448 = CCUG 49529]